MLEDFGGQSRLKSYIQSGNVVFQHAQEDREALANQIRAAINTDHDFEPKVLLLTASEFSRAIAANPYPQAEAEPKTLHLYFFKHNAALTQNLAQLEQLKKESEQITLNEAVFYLYAPEGIGRSKLAEKVEKALGVAATSS